MENDCLSASACLPRWFCQGPVPIPNWRRQERVPHSARPIGLRRLPLDPDNDFDNLLDELEGKPHPRLLDEVICRADLAGSLPQLGCAERKVLGRASLAVLVPAVDL